MTPADAGARRWILLAAAAGLVLRAAFGLLYWVDKPLTHDEREYLALARSLSQGRGFAYDASHETGTAQQFGRAPGYPAFLALIGAGAAVPDASPRRVKLTQACVGAATVWLLGVIALGTLGPRAGIAAAVLAAIYPPLVWINAYVFSETLYSAAALLTAWMLQRGVSGVPRPPGTGAWRHMASAGLLAGAAVLIRPAMLFFLPVAALWLAGTRRVALAAIFVAASLAVVAPWTVRNVLVHGRFVLVASEGGVTFWTGNHPLSRGEGDLAANPELKRAELEFRSRHPGLSAEDLEPLYYRDALASIAADPGRWLALLARKAFYTVVPVGPSYTLHSTRYHAASVVSYLLLLALAIRGFPRLWRSSRRPTAVLLLGVSAVLVGLIFFPQERFRIPVIDPVLILAASAAFSRSVP